MGQRISPPPLPEPSKPHRISYGILPDWFLTIILFLLFSPLVILAIYLLCFSGGIR